MTTDGKKSQLSFKRNQTSGQQWKRPLLAVPRDDPELKKRAYCLATKSSTELSDPSNRLMTSTSSFYKLSCRVSSMLRFKDALRGLKITIGPLKVPEIKAAEKEILKYVQFQCFKESISQLQQCKPVSKNYYLHKLNLFLDEEGIVRVFGRLSNSALNFETKHPILLHGDAYPVKLLIKQIHVRLGHLGLETVLGEVKRKFHILKGNKVIKDTIKSCVICRKVQGKVNSQIMAELPSDRVKGDDPPFFHTGTDLFGPFFVTKGRGNK